MNISNVYNVCASFDSFMLRWELGQFKEIVCWSNGNDRMRCGAITTEYSYRCTKILRNTLIIYNALLKFQTALINCILLGFHSANGYTTYYTAIPSSHLARKYKTMATIFEAIAIDQITGAVRCVTAMKNLHIYINICVWNVPIKSIIYPCLTSKLHHQRKTANIFLCIVIWRQRPAHNLTVIPLVDTQFIKCWNIIFWRIYSSNFHTVALHLIKHALLHGKIHIGQQTDTKQKIPITDQTLHIHLAINLVSILEWISFAFAATNKYNTHRCWQH